MTAETAPITERRFLLPLTLVTSLFFLWALGVNLNDVLIPHLKKAFSLTDFRSSLIQSAFFGGYFFAGPPGGGVLSPVGDKRGPLLGGLGFWAGPFLFVSAGTGRGVGLFFFFLFYCECARGLL